MLKKVSQMHSESFDDHDGICYTINVSNMARKC